MKVAIAIIAGLLLGIGANAVTRFLIKRRSDKPYSAWYINKPFSPVLWAVLFSCIIAWQWIVTADILWLLRLSVILFACACISGTDTLIRKVPNSMLLVLLLNTLVFLLLKERTVNKTELLIAVVISVVSFQLPSLFRLYIGAGDIKFAVLAAFELSLFGFLQAMIFVGIGFLVSAVYLGITKKGNLKTQIPMGPFIAAGLVLTTVCPLL